MHLYYLTGALLITHLIATSCGDDEIRSKGPKLEDSPLINPAPKGEQEDETMAPIPSHPPKVIQGEAGETGERGPQGEQGPRGTAGPQGDRGEQGTPGTDGSSCTVESDDTGAIFIACTDGTIEYIPTPTPGPTPTKCWETKRFKYCKYEVEDD